MRTLLVRGELPLEQVHLALQRCGVDLTGSCAYAFGSVRIAMYVGRKYYYRVGDFVGLAVLVSTDGSTQRLDIAGAGGARGLLAIELGAGDALEGEVHGALAGALHALGLPAGP